SLRRSSQCTGPHAPGGSRLVGGGRHAEFAAKRRDLDCTLAAVQTGKWDAVLRTSLRCHADRAGGLPVGQPVMAQTVRTADEVHAQLERVWKADPGLGALAAVNHSTIGIRFVVTGFVFFLIGGILAMLLRTQLAIPDNTALDHEQYNAAFTLHGTAMMFFFAVPIMEGFAVYVLPKAIGARDLVFPRLCAFGCWCYLFGGILLFSSLIVGTPPDAGWFLYTPL